MPLFKMVKNHKSNLTMKNTFDNTVKQSFKWYIQEKKEEKKKFNIKVLSFSSRFSS